MKIIVLYIIIFICAICFTNGQSSSFSIREMCRWEKTGRTVSLSKYGSNTIMLHIDTIFLIPPHIRASFKDSATVITGSSSFVQITNANDSLFCIYETNGINYIKGDTMQIVYKGGYFIIGMISGYGSVNTDWTVQWALKRNNVTTYGDAAIQFTTTGATNRNGGSSVGYGEFLPGDKLWMVIKRDGGVGDITLTTAKFCPMLYYREK